MNKLIMTTVGALMLLCSAASASTTWTWSGVGSNGWSDPANYTAGSGYPQPGDSVVIPDTKIAQVTTENDIALIAGLAEVTAEAGGELKFTIASTGLGSAVKLSGAGQVTFALNSATAFKTQWNGTGLTGTVLVSNDSSLQFYGTKCFGSAKVVAYASTKETALKFEAAASGTYGNEFEFHGTAGTYNTVLQAAGSDIVLSGKVRTYGGTTTCRFSAASYPGVHTKGSILFNGDFQVDSGKIHTTFLGNNEELGLPRITFGTCNQVLDLQGTSQALNCDANKIGANVIACAITNGTVALSHGNRWVLGVDDPMLNTVDATAQFVLAGDVSKGTKGGWVDLNGHHLLIGTVNGKPFNNPWSLLSSDAVVGGFCNSSETLATIRYNSMFGGNVGDSNPLRLHLDGNLSFEYAGYFAKYTGTGTDYDNNGSWSCWLGNYADNSSTLCGEVIAEKGALHMASSANFPNVSNFVAKADGRIYFHSGAVVNSGSCLRIFGAGDVKTDHALTFEDVFVDGVSSMPVGTYTTDDFGFINAIDGASKYNIAITGANRVAKVGDAYYDSLDAAIAAAAGTQPIQLLKDVDRDITLTEEKETLIFDVSLANYTGTVRWGKHRIAPEKPAANRLVYIAHAPGIILFVR